MEELVKQENQVQETKPSYSWYRDKKMIGMILLVVTVIFQIFAFLEVPFMSTIHAYTIGMLLGFYNPFFYFFVSYISLVMIFGEKMKLPKWVKLTKFSYWIVAISIVFIGASTGFYQSQTNGWTAIGAEPWNAINVWFDKFTSGPWWAPAQTDGGFIGVFLYALFSSAMSGIGALVVAIAALVISVSLIASGSFIGLYKQLHEMRKKSLESKEIKDEDAITAETLLNGGNDKKVEKVIEKPKQEVKVETIEKAPVEIANKSEVIKKPLQPKVETKAQEQKPKVEIDFPFEDPF